MSVPFTLVGIDHIVLWVRDLPRAKHWYCDVLGCRPGYDYPDIAMTHLWFGPVLLGLWDADAPQATYAASQRGDGTNVHHIALGYVGGTPEGVRAHLAAHDVEIVKEVEQTGGRGLGWAIYFNDPWGNLIELKGPPIFVAPQARPPTNA